MQQPVCNRPDLAGCAIDEVDFVGNDEVDSGDIADRIATAESSRLLGGAFEHVPVLSIWDTLTVDYERFDRFVLERDLARIERYYRARGFYNAHVRAGRVQRLEDGRVRVQVVVAEGAPVVIGAVELKWKDWSLERAKDVAKAVTDAKNSLKLGERFEEEPYEETKRAILRAMTDRGFAYATVKGDVYVDLVARAARVTYTIELGPECTFGKISLEGLGELPEGPLRAALQIEEGDRFSTEELDDAERALADFGVFGAIEVRPQLSPVAQPRNPVVPVVFRVQPAALRAVKLGGGAEVGGRVEAHLVAGWENRNLFGGLRRFSIEARPGLVFYPTRIGTLFDAPPTQILPEIQLRVELRQPATFEPRTTAVFRGAFRHYRLQTSELTAEDQVTYYQTTVDSPVGPLPVVRRREANIVGYREYAGSVGLERPFLKSDLDVSILYNLQIDDPFSYNEDAPPAGFGRIIIPYIQGIFSYDLRRGRTGKPDRIDPHKGIYVGTDVQLAGYIAGFGDPDDFRIQPEFRAYMPVSKKVTLGFRLLTGLLFPRNYGTAFTDQDRCSGVADLNTLSPENEAREACEAILQTALERDLQLLRFRAFFSGGASSNRGYGYNEVGPHGAVPSLTGGQTEENVPTGGLTLWESTLELRIPVAGNFGTAVFLDASDVTREQASFRLTRPHLAAGVGLRYTTPVGPLRADLGYRIPCAQVMGVCSESEYPEDEGTPGTVLGLPIAVSIAIGEAF